ncbi:MAG: ComF family protein [Clostridiales bacterium]|nr:ComF family protein [Clostridiales bacterium]
MKRLMEGIFALLYPDYVACILCGEEAILNEKGLCVSCEKSICRSEHPAQVRYASGFTAGLIFAGATMDAVHRLKYGDARYVAPFLASYIEIPPEWEIDVIVPIPLHWRRLWKRGYNQSALLAESLSGRFGIPVAEKLLRRVRYTKTQTALGAAQRTKNIRGAFSASGSVKGKRILLVDDVCTTGATLSTAAKALLDAGAAVVYACAACETKRD